MAKVEKSFLTPKWLEIKEMYEKGTNGSDKYGTNFEIEGELDMLCHDFIDTIGEFTNQFGFDCVIEGVKMDLWKERIWSLVENAGLLPEIAWRDELEAEKTDKWDSYEDEEYELDLDKLENEVFNK